MQFVIYQKDLRKYFSYHGKVIVFNIEEEAIGFANIFYQSYALPFAMGNIFGDPNLVGQVIAASNAWCIEELPEKYDYETITYEEIKEIAKR
jgi:hypothetical protein